MEHIDKTSFKKLSAARKLTFRKLYEDVQACNMIHKVRGHVLYLNGSFLSTWQ
jgi:hypothetical protein